MVLQMSGIKIINILKDDTFPEILELFRAAPAGEVIFVLPKNGRIFRREDHFAAFAAEAAGGQKVVSILTSNPEISAWARKYAFNVMSAGKPAPAPKKPAATLAAAPPPADPDIQDFSEDAFQNDVAIPGGERDEVPGADEIENEADPLHGMHIEEEGSVDEKDDAGALKEPTDDDLAVADSDFISASASSVHAELAAAVDSVRGGQGKSVKAVGGPGRVRSVPVAPAHEELDYIDAMWRDKMGKGSGRPPGKLSKGGRRISKTVAAGILCASFILLAVIVYLTTGSARVVITPTTTPVKTQLTVQASDVFSSVDENFNKIPGQLFQVTKTATQEATASGKRDLASKARGTLTVSNGYSSTPQALVATTRFASADGLIFRTLQTVTVPGSTVKNGAPVPGTVTVQVIADKPGPSYNIGSGKFTIPAFKERGDLDRYGKFTASSVAAMSGGASGPSSVVTQADYDAAKDAAVKAVQQQIKDAFAQQATGMTILDGLVAAVGDVTSTARPDDAATTFSVTATGTLKTVAFRQSDLFKLVAAALLKKDRLTVLPDKLGLSYGDITFKPDLGVLLFTASITGTGYAPLDRQAITNDIKGKDSGQVQAYFKDRAGVASATVTLSPFWVRSVPANPAKITLDIRYEDGSATH